jgi:hypothetical protein
VRNASVMADIDGSVRGQIRKKLSFGVADFGGILQSVCHEGLAVNSFFESRADAESSRALQSGQVRGEFGAVVDQRLQIR